MSSSSKNKKLLAWVDEMATLCQPDNIVWADGTDEEWDTLWDLMVEGGTARRINEEKRPNSFHVNSIPADVARVEDRTYICSHTEAEAGPTNNWFDPHEMREKNERHVFWLHERSYHVRHSFQHGPCRIRHCPDRC